MSIHFPVFPNHFKISTENYERTLGPSPTPLALATGLIAHTLYYLYPEIDISKKFKVLCSIQEDKVPVSEWRNLLSFMGNYLSDKDLGDPLGTPLPIRLSELWFELKKLMKEDLENRLSKIIYGFISAFDEFLPPIKFRVENLKLMKNPRLYDCYIYRVKESDPVSFFKPTIISIAQEYMKIAENKLSIEEVSRLNEFVKAMKVYIKMKRQLFAACDLQKCIRKRVMECPLRGIF